MTLARITADALQALRYVSQGRLTLASGVAVPTTDQTGASTLYFTPYLGDCIALYDGTNWALTPFTQKSVALSTGTASKPHDVFGYLSSGALAIELLAWTNDTTRATALDTLDGIYIKNGDSTRRYLGTIYLDGSKQCSDAAAARYVWNMHNRVPRKVSVPGSAANWSYATATWRQAAGNSANQFDFVRGFDRDNVDLALAVVWENTTKGYAGFSAFGLDSASTPTGAQVALFSYDANYRVSGVAKYSGHPGVGKHYLAWLEKGGGGGTHTWYGTDYACGIFGAVLA